MAKAQEIEVFRVGGAASRGITADHIAQVATFDCEANPLPICFGHPKSDTPAAGVISKLRAAGNSLFATILPTDKAVEGIKAGEWINRSFAFFDPTHEANPRPGQWSPRHLGLLGGAAPGIPGMGSLQKALAFDAAEDILLIDGDPADAVVFAGAATNVVFVSTVENEPMPLTAEEQARIDAADKALADLKAREDAFAAREQAAAAAARTAFEAGNSTSVDALVAAGKVLPAEAADLKAVFNALDADVFEFSATDKQTPGAKLAAFLSNAIGKRVPIDERRSPTDEFDAGERDDAATIDAKARKLMAERPGLTFGAAVEEVSNGGHVKH